MPEEALLRAEVGCRQAEGEVTRKGPVVDVFSREGSASCFQACRTWMVAVCCLGLIVSFYLFIFFLLPEHSRIFCDREIVIAFKNSDSGIVCHQRNSTSEL